MKYTNLNLKIKNWSGQDFHVSKLFDNSHFTKETFKAAAGKEMEFYLISEIKGTLDIEGEGSSRKIIKDLISGKRKPKSNNEQKAINLYSVMNFIKQAKPTMNKENLMIIYNILKTDIDMEDNKLENNLDYRQSDEEGYIGKFKTPSQSVMRKGMDDLFSFINSESMKEASIEKSLLIQIIFIYFHPFYDFNGRTGRLMTYWYLNTHGYEDIANSVYMALPENKGKYIKMFESMRKFKWSDLTTFLNFLMSVTAYGITKVIALENFESQNGISFNGTEKLIMFYLIDKFDWMLVNDLEIKIDLGISKQGLHNAIATLNEKGTINFKKQSNKSFVMSKKIMINKEIHPLKYFYKIWTDDMSASNLTIDIAYSKINPIFDKGFS